MFAVLLDALLFDEDCHHLATTTPLRFNAANDSFLKLSSRPLCMLLFVTGAEIKKHIQVQITWGSHLDRRYLAPIDRSFLSSMLQSHKNGC